MVQVRPRGFPSWCDTVKERHVFKPTSIMLLYGLGMHLFSDIIPFLPTPPSLLVDTDMAVTLLKVVCDRIRMMTLEQHLHMLWIRVSSDLNARGFKIIVEDYIYIRWGRFCYAILQRRVSDGFYNSSNAQLWRNTSVPNSLILAWSLYDVAFAFVGRHLVVC